MMLHWGDLHYLWRPKRSIIPDKKEYKQYVWTILTMIVHPQYFQVLSNLIVKATRMACLSWCTDQSPGLRLKIFDPPSIFAPHSPPSLPEYFNFSFSLTRLLPSNCTTIIQVSNIIFLDSPVGTGFSYSIAEQGYNSSDTKAVNQIVIFLRKVTSPASLISNLSLLNTVWICLLQ